MPERHRVGVGLEEMMQHMQQGAHVLAVAAGLRRSDVIDDHVADLRRSMLLVAQKFGEGTGCDLGDVLVLGDRQHLLLHQDENAAASLRRCAVYSGGRPGSMTCNSASEVFISR
jgi:hypothetical protein